MPGKFEEDRQGRWKITFYTSDRGFKSFSLDYYNPDLKGRIKGVDKDNQKLYVGAVFDAKPLFELLERNKEKLESLISEVNQIVEDKKKENKENGKK